MITSRKRRAGLALTGLLVLLAAAVAVGVTSDGDGDAGSEAIATVAAASETVTVSRQTLSQTESFDATIGHGVPLALPIDAQGTVTWAPEKDQVLSPGDAAVRINNRPVILVEGSVPLYRELRRVGSSERDEAGKKLGLQTGFDVAQLQAFLLVEGFDDDGRLEVDGTFGASTESAVEDWQESVGHPATGRVDRTQIIFIDSEVRVDETPIVGQPFGALTVTTPAQTVTGTIKSAQRSFFTEGTAIEVDADGHTLAGTVTGVTPEPAEDGTTRFKIEVTVDGTQIPEGVESVEVSATKTVADDVLTVPVRALLALAEGGWAVEVPTETGTELRRVELGEIVDTTAAISGVEEGTIVVVPT